MTVEGWKVPLGFVQAATENERVCRRFLGELVERGLPYDAGLLVVIDGGQGLYQAVRSGLAGHACVQRGQYHKRRNVVSYLPQSEQAGVRRKLEAAYGHSTYECGPGGPGGAQTGVGADEPSRLCAAWRKASEKPSRSTVWA